MRVAAMVACVGVLAAGGCVTRDAKPQAPVKARSAPDLSTAWRTTRLPVRSQPTAVKEGMVPLVYLVESGAVIRVHDQTAKLDLARSFAAPRSIVRVDGRRGVIYGDDTLLAGPLAEDHRYVIFVEPAGENVARQGVVQPRPRDAR
jgi:hypothetical protein